MHNTRKENRANTDFYRSVCCIPSVGSCVNVSSHDKMKGEAAMVVGSCRADRNIVREMRAAESVEQRKSGIRKDRKENLNMHCKHARVTGTNETLREP